MPFNVFIRERKCELKFAVHEVLERIDGFLHGGNRSGRFGDDGAAFPGERGHVLHGAEENVVLNLKLLRLIRRGGRFLCGRGFLFGLQRPLGFSDGVFRQNRMSQRGRRGRFWRRLFGGST